MGVICHIAVPSGEKSAFIGLGLLLYSASHWNVPVGKKKGKLVFSEENENHFFKTKTFGKGISFLEQHFQKAGLLSNIYTVAVKTSCWAHVFRPVIAHP